MSPLTDTTAPAEPFQPEELAELALDLRWSFNHATDRVWQRLDPELWALTHNPWFVLQTVSRTRLKAVVADPEFRRLLADVVEEKRQAVKSPAWFQQAHPHAALTGVAYLSMEFMLTEALPIYSGGLGNVAGDQLKTASNLAVPIVGIGLLYQQGYFRQTISPDGQQQAVYPFNDPGQLPIQPLRDSSGEWVRLSIPIPGSVLWIRVWQVQIGRVRLYLLDTNDPANAPTLRGVASELYGGDVELRLKQEIVLGIGGWRLLGAVGLRPEVCHLNEGHAAFAVLERARCYMAEHHCSFELALAVTRAGNVFTTHTPVDAGFDRFPADMMATYFGSYAQKDLSIPFDELMALGRRDRHDASEPFNMAYLGVRASGAVNGVSRLHGKVSRHIFHGLFPRWPEVEVPVTHVTNGVHMPTWDSAEADRFWETACSKDRWHSTMQELELNIRRVGDEALWELRAAGRRALIEYVREHAARQAAERGESVADTARAAAMFDAGTLTLGFARRFATYKRPNLLLHDADRLARILMNKHRPVQLVIAGKAHPADAAGQGLIAQWIAFISRPEVRRRAVFLSDYDMLMAERLVEGVDLWINTPRRPWEACGTSGMKVLVNGGLNLSELDGWWAEAYQPEVGWAIGDGQDRGDDQAWDASEADALYALLEGDVASAFYTRDDRGIPGGWVAKMRESMARLTPAFSANRAVREYVEGFYEPAATAFSERMRDGARRGQEIVAWRRDLERNWNTASIRALDIRIEGDRHLFRVRVDLGSLNPDHVQVELYGDGQAGDGPVRHVMTRREGTAGSTHDFIYTARLDASRPAGDFTARLVPSFAGASIPLEAPFILWAENIR